MSPEPEVLLCCGPHATKELDLFVVCLSAVVLTRLKNISYNNTLRVNTDPFLLFLLLFFLHPPVLSDSSPVHLIASQDSSFSLLSLLLLLVSSSVSPSLSPSVHLCSCESLNANQHKPRKKCVVRIILYRWDTVTCSVQLFLSIAAYLYISYFCASAVRIVKLFFFLVLVLLYTYACNSSLQSHVWFSKKTQISGVNNTC